MPDSLDDLIDATPAESQHYKLDDLIDEHLANQAPPHAPPTALNSGIRGFAQGGTFGSADEIGGAGMALLKKLGYAKSGVHINPQAQAEMQKAGIETPHENTFLEDYRSNRDDLRALDKQAKAENPKTFVGGEIAGGISTAAMPFGAAGKAAQGAKLGAGRQLLSAMATGGKYGLAGGLGTSEADSGLGVAKDTAMGGATGALGGAVLHGAGAALKGAIRGVIKPSEAAAYLRSKGVNDLTVGQMNPHGALAQLEEGATDLPIIGKVIEKQRLAAKQQWQNAVLKEGLAPGMGELPASPDINSKLDSIYRGYEPAYAASKNVQIKPTIPMTIDGERTQVPISQAFKMIARSPESMATRSEQNAAGSYLNDQVSAINNKLHFPETPSDTLRARSLLRRVKPVEADPISSGMLLKMRSNIRAKNKEMMGGSLEKANILSRSEGAINRTLEDQLPPDVYRDLQKVDGQYSKYKTIEDAVASGKDSPFGFTPSQLSHAVYKSSERPEYARGAGDELRNMAGAGIEALDYKIPKTGVRTLLAPISHLSSPLSAIANTPGVKKALLGEYGAQKSLSALLDGVGGTKAADLIRRSIMSSALRGKANEAQ